MLERDAKAVAELFDRIQEVEDPVALIELLCDQVSGLLGTDGAGVMIEDKEGHLRFVAASDPTLETLEQLQVALGEGPCLDTMRTGLPILVPDLAEQSTWTTFAPQAMAAGLVAVFSFPLRTARTSIGALNAYRSTPGPLRGDLAALAQLLASMAATVLVATEQAERATEVSQSLQRALDSRVVIEQAKGKIAAIMGVSPDVAFKTIRGFSRSRNLLLHDVAGQIVNGTLLQDIREWGVQQVGDGLTPDQRRAPQSE